MSAVTVEVKDHIAIITLDRPDTNSLVRETYQEFVKVFHDIGERDDVRAAVLKAEGKFFCGGNDVEEIRDFKTEERTAAALRIVSDGIASVYTCKVPVVAAMQGHAVGAGMALAACADVIIASDKAKFAIPEIKVGIIGASGFMSLLVPEKVARYLALTGGAIAATEVERYGGVHKTVPTEEVFDAALEVAQEISRLGPTAVRHFKDAMNRNHAARLVEKYATEASYTSKYVGSDECNETLNAFFEKREPVYR